MASNKKSHGFTLVEMSMVLIAIGLISGAIVVGQSMLRASQLRSSVAAFSTYTLAINNFRDKYMAYPGDLPNATSYWGSETTCPNTPYSATLRVVTCNGDGDGLIDYDTNEMFRVWQHLSNAGMIEGSYNGISGTGGSNVSVIGVNSPRSQLSKAGYSAFFFNGVPPSSHWWPVAGTFITLGTEEKNDWAHGGALTPAEAYQLDSKEDDGNPTSGKIIALKPPLTNQCLTNSSANAQYRDANSDATCSVVYDIGY